MAINDYKTATLKVMVIGETKEKKPIRSGYDAYEVMKFITKEDRECFYVLHLNAKNMIIGKELVSVGTLTNSLVHPREIFKGAILNNSASIICVHNHPSGDTTPSSEDIQITNRLVKAGEFLGISVLDHVIIGEGYTSLYEFYGADFKIGQMGLSDACRGVKKREVKTTLPKKNILLSKLLNELIEDLKIVYHSDQKDLKVEVFGIIRACADEVKRGRNRTVTGNGNQ